MIHILVLPIITSIECRVSEILIYVGPARPKTSLNCVQYRKRLIKRRGKILYGESLVEYCRFQ